MYLNFSKLHFDLDYFLIFKFSKNLFNMLHFQSHLSFSSLFIYLKNFISFLHKKLLLLAIIVEIIEAKMRALFFA